MEGWKVQGVLSFPLFPDTFRKGWKVRALEFLHNSQRPALRSLVFRSAGRIMMMKKMMVTMMMMVVTMTTTWPLGVERCVREATKCANSWAVLFNIININIEININMVGDSLKRKVQKRKLKIKSSFGWVCVFFG